MDALDVACLAFRRDDYAARGPVDERLRTPRYVGLWLSLALREERERPPRRAVALDGLPIARFAVASQRDAEGGDGDDAGRPDRLGRRDYYRVLERFGSRPELVGSRATGTVPGEAPRPEP